ncbi:uncharacterized protein JN550_004546 [Neoarthrinium moseri]|uniref:uncharacterized protein n=1 Tax=Neoarthrinium moseri TaxID=1658444 RepID=UPI001FDC1A49|nr:uncharacterized protein JN550_004546 [Neoarthrinium moseri]KAI1871552.1 hypothetical protein JN550_004546 [Neoarthrinium moseri]
MEDEPYEAVGRSTRAHEATRDQRVWIPSKQRTPENRGGHPPNVCTGGLEESKLPRILCLRDCRGGKTPSGSAASQDDAVEAGQASQSRPEKTGVRESGIAARVYRAATLGRGRREI